MSFGNMQQLHKLWFLWWIVLFVFPTIRSNMPITPYTSFSCWWILFVCSTAHKNRITLCESGYTLVMGAPSWLPSISLCSYASLCNFYSVCRHSRWKYPYSFISFHYRVPQYEYYLTYFSDSPRVLVFSNLNCKQFYQYFNFFFYRAWKVYIPSRFRIGPSTSNEGSFVTRYGTLLQNVTFLLGRESRAPGSS